MKREDVLNEANIIVSKDRESQYGSPENSFGEIAKLWSGYIGREITPHDVAIMMALMKIARIKCGKYKEDSYIDACGYIACAGELGFCGEDEKEWMKKK